MLYIYKDKQMYRLVRMARPALVYRALIRPRLAAHKEISRELQAHTMLMLSF